MKRPLKWLGTILAALLTPLPARAGAPPVPAAHVAGVEHHYLTTNGVRLHYVVAGEGDPVVLVSGWPQSWYAWRAMIPRLVRAGRKVYALDPRGFGDSDKPRTGYDLKTAATDLHGFLKEAGIAKPGGVDIVSHDVGTWIGYTLAVQYPRDVRRIILSEAAMPGTLPPPSSGTPNEAANLRTWHFGFNRLDGLPEMLIEGRERAYLRWLFAHKTLRHDAIDAAAIDEYARAMALPGGLRAQFEYYRVNFTDAELADARARNEAGLTMPVLTIGGSGGVGQLLQKTVAAHTPGAQGVVLEGCGHFLPEECPGEMTDAILAFWNNKP